MYHTATKRHRHHHKSSVWTRYRLGAKLKVLLVLVLVVMLIPSLRNSIVPGWPDLWQDLNSLKVARINLEDLFFSMDNSKFTGSCKPVHDRLASVRMPRREDMPFYDPAEWATRLKNKQSAIQSTTADQQHEDLAARLTPFKPSLTPREQQSMLFALLSALQALSAFNIPHFISHGTLIGYWRHHGLIPWDDDADLLFDGKDWALAKQVLSCLPGLELQMGSDFMWKLFDKEAPLWSGEDVVRFPFIDIFPYRYDSEHLWPLCIWFKQQFMARTDWVLPPSKGIFEGWLVSVPRKPHKVLWKHYGHGVMQDCYSRTFLRKERYLVPEKDRTHLPCTSLYGIYPFVRRSSIDPSVRVIFEERMLHPRVLSTFNATYSMNTFEFIRDASQRTP